MTVRLTVRLVLKSIAERGIRMLLAVPAPDDSEQTLSLQIAILKVLSGHDGGHASLDALKTDLAILSTSGPDWSDRMKALAANAQSLDIFSEGCVQRNPGGWTITPRGP